MRPVEFGYQLAAALEKHAGGWGAGGKTLGGMLAGAAKAAPAKPAANAAQAGISSAPRWLQANQAAASGRQALARELSVPAGQAPPVPAAPVRVSPAEAAAGRAKVTISPAEAAAGRAKMTITPGQAAASTSLPKTPGLVTPGATTARPRGFEASGWFQ